MGAYTCLEADTNVQEDVGSDRDRPEAETDLRLYGEC